MSLKNYRVLSLDISSSSTGWSFICGANLKTLKFGTIAPDPKLNTTMKLDFFRNELKKLFIKFKPNYIILEDTFLGNNPKVAKLLAKFAGVAEQSVFEFCQVIPYIMGNTTPKSFFKAKNKEALYTIIVDLFAFEEMSFGKCNDITDSIAQLLCYCDEVIKIKKVRMEKEYGYQYDI